MTNTSDSQGLINALQLKARTVLDNSIPINAEVVLLDYPHYPNVGDSMIWLGEIAYLISRHAKLIYVSSISNYSYHQLKSVCSKETLILISGGGNFGDLWPNLHAFKLKVIRDFPNHRIIQLPQTIHFEQAFSAIKTAEAIEKHGQFTLLVSSHRCLDYAKKYFDCNSVLCPDMAFFIGLINMAQSPVVDKFILSRTDIEKSNQEEITNLNHGLLTVEQGDWLQTSFAERKMFRVEKFSAIYRRYFDKYNLLLLHLWNRLCVYRLKRGMAMLRRGEEVITDRLHGHIICTLMNKPHQITDNTYGKLSHFYYTWKSFLGSVKLMTRHADSPSDVSYVKQSYKVNRS